MQGSSIDVISSINVLIYCDLIKPQCVSTDNVRLLHTVVCPTQLGNHLFQKTHFRDIRIELRETNGEPGAFEASFIPIKVVLHFRSI